MKKQFHLWFGILLVLSLALPTYLTAGNLTFILPDGSGAGIADQPFDSFFLDLAGNLTVVLPYFPDINHPQVTWALSCPSGSGCTVNIDGASITADANATFSFNISSTSPADVTNVYPRSGSGAIFSTKNNDGTYTFTWSRPAGNYIAVFSVGQSPSSQKVVDIVVVAADPVVKFVTNFYQKILSQPLSSTDAWVSALKNHTQTGEDIATAFFITSQQGQNLTNSQFVTLLYQVLLMRDPEPGAVDFWVGTGLSRADLLHSFVTCQEFAAKCNTLGILAYTQTQTYTVTVDNPTQTGGSVSPASRTVNPGDTATFTVTITQGYTATPSTGSLSGTTGTVTWTIPSVNSSIHVSITFTQQTPPLSPNPPVQGEVLPWNMNHMIIQFQPNETKTFIARVTTNDKGAYARVITVSFQTMGATLTGSFKYPLKPDGTPYRTSNGVTEYNGFVISNEGSASFVIGVGGMVLDPHIYPGDFIFTLTSDKTGGWGYMSTSITY